MIIQQNDQTSSYLSSTEPNQSTIDIDAPYTWCRVCTGVCTCDNLKIKSDEHTTKSSINRDGDNHRKKSDISYETKPQEMCGGLSNKFPIGFLYQEPQRKHEISVTIDVLQTFPYLSYSSSLGPIAVHQRYRKSIYQQVIIQYKEIQ